MGRPAPIDVGAKEIPNPNMDAVNSLEPLDREVVALRHFEPRPRSREKYHRLNR
jgi:hypothetical protein